MIASTALQPKPFRNGGSTLPRKTARPLTSKRRFRFRSGQHVWDQTSKGFPPNLQIERRPCRLGTSSLALLEGRIDQRVGTNLVIGAVGPSLDDEVRRIDTRNSALAHHDLAVDVAVDRNGRAEELVLSLIGRR